MTAVLKAFHFNHHVTWFELRKGDLDQNETFVRAVITRKESFTFCVHPCLKAHNLNFITGSIRNSDKTQRF